MGFVQKLFAKYAAKKAATEVVQELETKPAEQVFEPMAAPTEGEVPTREQFSVTGQYEIVSQEMIKAVEEGKKVSGAAKRLLDAIGVGPSKKED